MTIEEIKEIRATVLTTEQEYFDAHSVEMVDTLLEEVERLNEENERDRCHGRDFIRLWKEGKDKLTIATEALESLISANTQRITTARYIACTALERIKE